MGVKLTSARYSTVDVNENKLIDVLDGTADGDGVNYSQIKDLNGNVYTLHEGTDAGNTDTFQRYYLSLDGGTTHVGTPVAVGADEITAVTTQRNDAGQTRAQWMTGEGFTAIAEQDYAIGDTFFYVNDANERANYVVLVAFTAVLDSDATVRDAYITGLVTANTIAVTSTTNFVADARYALTTISLAKDLQLLANDSYVAMDVATENGNDYHFDLLRFQGVNGRLVLQTDRLVTRLEQIGGNYPRAARADDTDFDQDFMVVQGSVWYFEDNLWLYEGDSSLAITSDATTFSNRPQAITSDWVRLHNINWSQHITYYQGDVVTFSSRFYTVIPVTIEGNSTNANPANDTTRWRLVSPGVPDGTATGEILVWDNDTSQYRAVRLLINGVDTNGATEAENFILDGIIDDPATRATTRAWQETFLLEKVTVLPETTKASTLAPGTPVAGDSLYLTEAYTDSADSTVYNRGSYTYTGVSGTDGAWGATGGPLGAFSVVGTPVAGTTDVLKYTNANTLTWSADDGEDLAAIQAEVDAVEVEVDAIQAHETTIDHRLDVLEAEVANLEQTYDGEYTWENNPTIDALLTDNRVDSQGNNPSQSDILSSEYNPDSNVLRWWISSTIEDATITEFINQGDAIGFSDGIETPVPFVAIGNGSNATNTAKYIDFKLQQEETYESILEGYADDTEVIFETTLYFFNTANDNFNQADHDAGDHHRATPLTPGQLADLTEIEAVASDRILVKDADGTIVGDQRLNSDQYTILDNLEIPMTAAVDVDSIIPDADTRIVLDTYETGGAPEDGEWYWRQQNVNPGSGAAATIFNPTTWADLADRPDGGETDSTLWRQLMCQAEAVDAAKFNTIRAGVGQFDAGTTTVDDADLGDFFVAGYDNATGEVDLNNWAVIRAISTPDNATNNDVRFRIHSITNSAGVPPNGDAAGAANQSLGIVISHVSETITTTAPPMRNGDPNFQENLRITGTATIEGNLNVTGTITGDLVGETVQLWPDTLPFTISEGQYWETKGRIYRRTSPDDLPITDAAGITNNVPIDNNTGWVAVTKEANISPGVGIGTITNTVDGVTTTTVSADTILSRAEVTVPSIQNQVLRTGAVSSILTFLGITTTAPTVGYQVGTTPTGNQIAFLDSGGAATTVWDDLATIVIGNGTTSNAVLAGQTTGAFLALTYGATDNPDLSNWALLSIQSTPSLNGTIISIAVDTENMEHGGTIQAETVRIGLRTGAFRPERILDYVEEETPNVYTLGGEVVFDLEQTGIITATEVDPDTGDVIALGNTNTQFGINGTGSTTATVHHQPMDSMAYLALQFNSVFAGVRGQVTDPVTPQNAAITDNTRDVDLHVYIEYLSTFNGGTQNVTFVDRVRLSDGETQTRMYDSAAPAAFSPGGTIINQR